MLAKKKIYIEILRIIGAVMVSLIHTRLANSWYFDSYSMASKCLLLAVVLIIRTAVPLFMMISGAVLLCKTEDKKSYIRKIVRVLVIIFLVSLVSQILNGNVSIKPLLLNMLNLGGIHWYLYWWLSFTILLPIYQKIAKALNDSDYVFIFKLFIIFQIMLPTINLIAEIIGYGSINMSSSFSLHILTTSFLYPFIGYYIEHRLSTDKVRDVPFLAMIMVSVICILAEMGIIFAYKKACGIYETFSYLTPIIATAFYLIIKKIFIDYDYQKNEKLTKLILFFSEQTLGVYAFSILVPASWIEFYKGFFSPFFSPFVVKTINFISRYLFITIVVYIAKKMWSILLDLIKSIKYN